jgi:putative transposase
MEFLMEQEMAKSQPTIDYQSYVIKRQLEDYWRADEKVQSHSHKKLFKGVAFAHNVKAERSNSLWGIDMTYIWCGEDAWCYFHGVIDHYDKTLLGYHFSRSCAAIGGVMALANAASERPVDTLELRSDNGCHYGAKVFKEEIRRLGINHTRTMVNTPKGNAVIERFFRSLKEECVWQQKFHNFEEAKNAVNAWINEYNQNRPHQTLGYVSPKEFYDRPTLVLLTIIKRQWLWLERFRVSNNRDLGFRIFKALAFFIQTSKN